MTEPVIVVAGLGRCGTTMLMHMLKAGGIPVAGAPPGFECDETLKADVDAGWFTGLAGQAVKLIDPHHHALPDVPIIVIFLTRGATQQARSQAKFATAVTGHRAMKRHELKRWRKVLLGQEKRARRALGRHDVRWWLNLSFESVIQEPDRAARTLAVGLRAHGFDVGHWTDMAAVVDARSSICAPGLDKEVELALEAKEAATPIADGSAAVAAAQPGTRRP